MAAYTPYDLFRILVERVGWPQETDKTVALQAIGEWEAMAIFGNLAVLSECRHEDIGNNGRCLDCGKQIQSGPNPRPPTHTNPWR